MRSFHTVWLAATFFTVLPVAAQPLTFDAASVKPAAPPGPDSNGRVRSGRGPGGGPGANDPGRIHYPGISLKNLLMNAYDVKTFQVGGPNWLPTELFQVDATMPPDTSREQFRVMLQNLLAERFKLTLYRETRELSVYALVVARNGPKLKMPADVPYESGPPPAPSGPPKLGPDGFPLTANLAGRRGIFFQGSILGDRCRIIAQQQSMRDLANDLTGRFGRPVRDETGLAAKYDFTVTLAPDEMWGRRAGPPPTPPEGESLPDFFAAIQAQLGLKLNRRRGRWKSSSSTMRRRRPPRIS